MTTKPITVFYSWQSWTERSHNHYFIKRALEDAAKKLEKILGQSVIIDRDTKGLPGLPPIADAILEKITKCDIFVGDVTPVTRVKANDEDHHVPNPNVMMELGFALRHLGWERIILVMNNSHGKFKHLPFDIIHRRWPIEYTLNTDENKLSTLTTLSDDLAYAIKLAVTESVLKKDVDHPTILRARNMLVDPDENISRKGAEALGKIEDDVAIQILKEVASDNSTPVNQMEAAIILATKSKYTDLEVITGLERALDHHLHADRAREYLLKMNCGEAAAALVRGLDKVQPHRVKPIVSTLVQMTDESVIPYLRQIRHNPENSGNYRVEVLKALSEFRDLETVQDIIMLLTADNISWDLRVKCLQMLAKYDSKIYVQPIFDYFCQYKVLRTSEQTQIFNAGLQILKHSENLQALELLKGTIGNPEYKHVQPTIHQAVNYMKNRIKDTNS